MVKAFPRPSPHGIPEALPQPSLRSLPRPGFAALRLAAGCSSGLPRRAGGAASAAGAVAIAVLTGFAQREALITAPPDYLLPDLTYFLAHVPL